MSSSCSLGWTPDVFVSFENDVFKSPLCKELQENGIGFRSTNDREKDKAIRQARFALILLSTEYTQRSECLDELVKILNRRGESEYLSLVVIPIFYRIDLSTDLQIGKKLERNESDENKKRRWRCALAQVGGIPGYELRAGATKFDEAALITPIIERLLNEMRSLYSYKVFGPFEGKGEICWHSGEINGDAAFYTDLIKSITFKVDPRTTKVQPGTSNRQNPFKVKLEPGERITYFGGYFEKANGGGRQERILITSLTFRSNKNRKLEPISTESGPFPVPLVAGEFIEFFVGKKGKDCLTSIRPRAKLPSEDSHPVGLFGIRTGSKWDHHDEHTTVRGIRVALDSTGNGCVRWITFLYDEVNGKWSTDGSNKKPYEEFIIDDPDEYLSSISGSLTSDGITSLTVLTNKKRPITIGDAKGSHFSSPVTGGKIVGFYGWSDKQYLHGIGAYLKPTPTPYRNQVTSIGPFGGGHAWDDGIHKGVKEIYLLIDGDIRYIRFVYDDDGKECRVTHSKGVSRQKGEKKVPLNENEYFTSISGYTGDNGSIQSLTFYTNKRSHEYVTTKGGTYFRYPSTRTNRIVGFYGTWGNTLNSIGAYGEPITSPPPTVPFGPFPDGSGGDLWDDKEHSHVVGYRVTPSKDNDKIESITFMYYDNGSLVEGSPHGGGDPSSGEWTMLNFPEERLTSLSGYSRKEGGQSTTRFIHNLQLYTTTHPEGALTVYTYAKRKSGLAGSEEFRIVEDSGRRISGFFPRASTCLNSIGAYVGSY